MKPIRKEDVAFKDNKEVIISYVHRRQTHYIHIKNGDLRIYRSKMSREAKQSKYSELKKMREPASRRSFEDSLDEIEDNSIPKEF
mgnify:CR=1 FL=1